MDEENQDPDLMHDLPDDELEEVEETMAEEPDTDEDNPPV